MIALRSLLRRHDLWFGPLSSNDDFFVEINDHHIIIESVYGTVTKGWSVTDRLFVIPYLS